MSDGRIPADAEDGAVPSASGSSDHSGLFASSPSMPSSRGKVIGAVVAIGVLAVVALVFFLQGSGNKGAGAQNAIRAADPYASSLSFTQLAMSESTSLSGGKSTFIDGCVKNIGPATLTGVTMQVLFRNDVGLSPQVETLPLTLIRTREPYVDTEPVSVAPLKPGDEVEFRLIFETVNANWNQQMPELRVVQAARR